MKSPKQIWDDGRAVLRARVYLRSAELGQHVRLWGTPIVANYGTLRVGDRARLVSTVAKLELSVGGDALLEIGESTFINYGTSIGATQLVRIGKGCAIGSYAILMDNDFHSLDPARRNELPPSQPIVLGDNVWLGARVTVLRGVTIGKDSVIAAGSVVTRDVPPGVLAAGVPARVIRAL